MKSNNGSRSPARKARLRLDMRGAGHAVRLPEVSTEGSMGARVSIQGRDFRALPYSVRWRTDPDRVTKQAAWVSIGGLRRCRPVLCAL